MPEDTDPKPTPPQPPRIPPPSEDRPSLSDYEKKGLGPGGDEQR